MHFFALPTWLITKMVLPFLPKHHQWHGKTFSLRNWYYGQTPLCGLFDWVFWMVLINFGLFWW